MPGKVKIFLKKILKKLDQLIVGEILNWETGKLHSGNINVNLKNLSSISPSVIDGLATGCQLNQFFFI